MNANLNKRIVSIDRMRGFSLLGIFLVNMISFHSPLFYMDPETWWNGEVNRWTYRLIDVFVQASFYPLFAMLFGYGMTILRERTIQRGANFSPIVTRRLVFLLLIGISHAFLVWDGDILITYAICGLFFLPFIRMKKETLLKAGLILYIVPNLLLTGLLGLSLYASTEEAFSMYDKAVAEKAVEIYQSGSFVEITKYRLEQWYDHNQPANFLFYFFTILPLFFIGAAAAQMKFFDEFSKRKKTMFNLGLTLLLAGLIIKAIPYLTERNVLTDFGQDIFGGPLLAVAYALMIAWLSDSEKANFIMTSLEAAGRLSISNYLFQSVFCTWIFYSYGLGFYGKITIFEGALFAIIVYAFQLTASKWWIKTYQYGPVEWIWRGVTYWKRPKWKKSISM